MEFRYIGNRDRKSRWPLNVPNVLREKLLMEFRYIPREPNRTTKSLWCRSVALVPGEAGIEHLSLA